MTDVLLIETGNGGDLRLGTNDLKTVNGLENAIYLALFGGKKWWANYTTSNKFLSQTEQVLRTTPLTSSGRIAIERAINSDLSFLNNITGTKWTVNTTITSSNRLEINIDINGQLFLLQWNPDSLFLTYKVPMI